MTQGIDLDAYFQRIGYEGGRAPTLETLRALHRLHPETIPFENLDPLLKRPVLLDSASLERKLVREGRGGYCFEHNLLFRDVLKAIGFSVTGLAARVLWNAPEGAVTPRTHMLLRVEIDGEPYVADVGFGGQVLTGPLRLELDVEQATPHEPFRLVRSGEKFVMQSKIRDAWVSLYRFDLQEQFPPDYEVANWYVSTHPASIFVNGLLAARTTPDRRYALRNNQLAVHHLNGGTDKRTLATAAEIRETLQAAIGLTLPDAPGLDEVLTRLIAQFE
ncbi:MAG: arylamine N-acetyltransferase [Paludisphaera borealis]|uniref:arylamine N-acetyltransferase family protein n=1 Tax=Paludisphaera borealis TaxID=1387353 RepID=UPI002849DB1F|nr:arylamine N-acetyltransferase [Paludisphaera borealis]MDR3622605.1 arylamine N-acetyltransferase [Paludisphaera borealis]